MGNDILSDGLLRLEIAFRLELQSVQMIHLQPIKSLCQQW